MFARRFASLLIAVSVAAPTTVHADGNAAYLAQGGLPGLEGVGNQAKVDQSGGTGNSAGQGHLVMQQSGLSNDLFILQDGDLNRVGVVSLAPSGAAGLLQSSNSATGINRARISQVSNANIVETVEQTAQGAGQIAVGNNLSVDQGRAGQAASDGNTIRNVFQMRAGPVEGNSAALRQFGAGNRIEEIRQYASDPSGGSANSIQVEQDGDENGLVPLAGQAALSGALGGRFVQGVAGAVTYGNRLDLVISGSGNQAGTVQTGIANRIGAAGPVMLQGDHNQFGAVQTGLGNDLSLRILGDRNDVGSVQSGVDNRIEIDVSPAGSDNRLSVQQDGSDNSMIANLTGDLNDVLLQQDGMGNNSLFDVIGNQNRIDGRQSGTTNSAIVTQNGNHNSATFSQLGGFNAITINQ